MATADSIYAELNSHCEEMNKCIPAIQMAISVDAINNPAKYVFT